MDTHTNVEAPGRSSPSSFERVRIDAIEVERLLEVLEPFDAACLATPDGVVTAAVGARWIEVRGPRGLADVRGRMRRQLDAEPEVPLLGGAAFDGRAAPSGGWEAFGRGGVLVPDVTLEQRATETTLCVRVVGGDNAAARARLSRLSSDLTRPGMESSACDRAAATEAVESDALWSVRLADIDALLSAGTLEKVVAARAVHVTGGANAIGAFTRLRRSAPRCAAFFFRRRGSVFFGATPERLVRVRGRFATSEAVAGSAACDETTIASMCSSDKEMREHRIVVEEIVRALRSASREVYVDPRPHTRRLTNIAHLVTAIRAELAAGGDALALVDALHPTPALAGHPRGPALDFITAREPTPRGWYGGPIGRFDANGDADVWVAIRSALHANGVATVFAGAGIVRGSNAADELRETKLKMAPMLAALGVPS